MDANQGVLQEILKGFTRNSKLEPVALWLFASLIVIDLILAVAMNLGSPDTIKTLVKRILKYGLIKFIIENWDSKLTLMNLVLNGFTRAGELAAGAQGASDNPLHQLLTQSERIIKELIKFPSIDIFNIPSLTDLILIPLLAIIIFMSFMWIGISYVVTMVEFDIISTLALILIPFGGLKQTAFITQKVTNAVINFGIKVMVLSFLMQSAIELMKKMNPAEKDLTLVLYLLVFSILLAFLSWHAPSLVASLMNGSSSMSANTVLGDAAQGVQVAAAIGAAVATGGASLGATGAAAGAGAGASAAGAGAGAATGSTGVAAGGAGATTAGAGMATGSSGAATGSASSTTSNAGSSSMVADAGAGRSTPASTSTTTSGTDTTSSGAGAANGSTDSLTGDTRKRGGNVADKLNAVSNIAGIIANAARNSDKS